MDFVRNTTTTEIVEMITVTAQETEIEAETGVVDHGQGPGVPTGIVEVLEVDGIVEDTTKEDLHHHHRGEEKRGKVCGIDLPLDMSI